jgi:hypothetical protein
MTRIMRDSTAASDIPVKGTELVAGYANGDFEWTAKEFGLFPGIPHVRIDVNGTDPSADVADVEQGDVFPVTRAVDWVKEHNAAKPAYPAIIYVNRSNLTPLFNALNGAGLEVVKDFRLWVATLDGTKAIPDMKGVTAVQYAGQAQTGGHFDQSIVYDDLFKAPVSAPLSAGWVALHEFGEKPPQVYFNLEEGTLGYHDTQGVWQKVLLPRA